MTGEGLGKKVTHFARRRPGVALLAVGFVSVVGWGYWAWWADRAYRDRITAIELEMANGRFGLAARDLIELLEREPADGEAAFLLGRCEQERGRTAAAMKAFARIAPGSAHAHKAILARMRLLHDQGQLAAAERLIEEVAADPRSDRAHVRALLVPIYSQLGLIDEAKGLLEDRWDELNKAGKAATEPAIDQVRMHIELDFRPNPVENVRQYLDQAARLAPDDDRVWLGQANLAIRTGKLDEARGLLERCSTRRPEDAAVWRARLAWAIAAGKTDAAFEAMRHLPAGRSDSAPVHGLAAWVCAQRGDSEGERKQLERLIAADAADQKALARLVEIAERRRDGVRAEELKRMVRELERDKSRYETLFDRNQSVRDAEELSEIASRLGRHFEARAFLSIEVAEDTERLDLADRLRGLVRMRSSLQTRSGSLADAVTQALAYDGAQPEKSSEHGR